MQPGTDGHVLISVPGLPPTRLLGGAQLSSAFGDDAEDHTHATCLNPG